MWEFEIQYAFSVRPSISDLRAARYPCRMGHILLCFWMVVVWFAFEADIYFGVKECERKVLNCSDRDACNGLCDGHQVCAIGEEIQITS